MVDDSLNRIVEKVAHEVMPQSVRLWVSISQSKRQVPTRGGSSSLVLEQTYFETDRGERYFDEKIILPNEAVTHSSSYCDGKKCANITFSTEEPDRQERVTIGHDFMTESMTGFRDAPPPFRFYHVGLIPLPEALASAERLGRVRVIQRNCNDFHFKDVGPSGRKQSLVYSLDEETSVPLRIAAYADPDRLHDGMPNWVWEAATLDKVSDRHFPLSSTYSSFRVTKTDTGQWTSRPDLTRTIQVKEITFDAAIPHTAFWPTIQPGVLVLDAITKRKYREPGGAPTTKESAGAGARDPRCAESPVLGSPRWV